MNAMR